CANGGIAAAGCEYW
nr:immunoglobulin heavy chain junction region [Macaca mulatta]